MITRAMLLSVCVFSLAAIGLAAQTRAPTGTNPAVVPTEPEIIMPQVILQIEDLSVEKVEAQLPPEEDLLPPERKIPMLSEGDLAIGEPSIPAPGADMEPTAGPARGRLLSSDINLGAGSQNRILGSISLKTLGEGPRFSLLFNHETFDGFAGNPSGSGFNLRNDLLNGTLKFGIGGVDTSLSGTFSENETGLQGRSPQFTGRLGRMLGGTAAFSAVPLDWLTLRAGAAGDTDTLTMLGAPPQLLTGARVAPSLSAVARFGAVKIGLESIYSFRIDPQTDQSPGGSLHRLRTTASFGADLSTAFILEGSVGWFLNSAGLSLFPFAITMTGTPFEFLTVTLSGGYKVTPYDMHDLMSIHPLVLPNSISDDRGWFADASVQLTFTRDLSATMKAAYMSSDAMPIGSSAPYLPGGSGTGTGLFPVTQKQGTLLSSSATVRLAITQSLSLSGGWTHQFLDRPFFTPIDSLTGELIALDSTGRFGGSVSVAWAPTFTAVLQQPVLRASAFWKVSDIVKLQLEGDDLLGILPGDPRLDLPPYNAPGFRVTGSLSISL